MFKKFLVLLLSFSLMIPFGYIDNKVKAITTKGMDISEWQGKINWDEVAKSDIKFTIIRTSGRFISRRTFYEDERFQENVAGANKIGMPKGAYHYCAATNIAEAKEEANFFISKLKPYNWELPVCLDMEANDSLSSISYDMRTNIAMAFLRTLAANGYKAMLYTNLYWANHMLDINKIQSKFPIWIAQYYDHCEYDKGPIAMWQFTNSGRVPGISGNVDLNYSYINIPLRK